MSRREQLARAARAVNRRLNIWGLHAQAHALGNALIVVRCPTSVTPSSAVESRGNSTTKATMPTSSAEHSNAKRGVFRGPGAWIMVGIGESRFTLTACCSSSSPGICRLPPAPSEPYPARAGRHRSDPRILLYLPSLRTRIHRKTVRRLLPGRRLGMPAQEVSAILMVASIKWVLQLLRSECNS